MDQLRFDTLTRTLGKRTNRRSGVFGAIGAMLGVAAAPETDAARKATRRHEKLACRNANSQCLSDDECCSGSCVPKFGGTSFRCAKRHAKKDHDRRKADPVTCTVCANGCVYSTIEDAVADAAPGAVITVGPGTYIPAPGSGDTYGAIRLTQDITLKACDPNDPPTITGSIDTTSYFLVSIGVLDDQSSCEAEQPTVVFDGINFAGDSELFFAAMFVICNSTWTLRNADVSYFRYAGSFAYPALTILSGTGTIDSCTIHDNRADSGGPYASTIMMVPFSGQPAPSLDIRDSVVSSNTGLFGAIGVISAGSLTLSGNTRIRDNISTGGNGGGVYISGEQTFLTIGEDVAITLNTCPDYGGGVYVTAETTVTGATAQTIFGNSAAECLNFFQDPSTCILN